MYCRGPILFLLGLAVLAGGCAVPRGVDGIDWGPAVHRPGLPLTAEDFQELLREATFRGLREGDEITGIAVVDGRNLVLRVQEPGGGRRVLPCYLMADIDQEQDAGAQRRGGQWKVPQYGGLHPGRAVSLGSIPPEDLALVDWNRATIHPAPAGPVFRLGDVGLGAGAVGSLAGASVHEDEVTGAVVLQRRGVGTDDLRVFHPRRLASRNSVVRAACLLRDPLAGALWLPVNLWCDDWLLLRSDDGGATWTGDDRALCGYFAGERPILHRDGGRLLVDIVSNLGTTHRYEHRPGWGWIYLGITRATVPASARFPALRSLTGKD